jgi:uncharacterized protein with HEPN domain
MSSRTDAAFIEDMREAARRGVSYVAGLTYEVFLADTRTQDAVVRNIEIVGEAAKNVSESGRSAYPTVAWRQVTGMRDRLVHHYFGVNFDIVWHVATTDLPDLLRKLM